VDLTLGEPVKKTTADGEYYEYTPPPEADIFERLMISYHRDSKQVSRLDAIFEIPHSAESIRNEMQLGKRILNMDRSDGGFEEFYYPKLHALIFGTRTPDARVAAISYFSPRFLSDLFVNRARDLINAQKFSEASDEADKAVLVDPDYARGYIAQGWCYKFQKNYDEAITRFQAAANARYAPHSKGQAHTEMGLIYWDQKKLPDKAQAELQQGATIAPDYYFTHFQYGRFLRAQKQEALAQSELARALELDPSRQEIRNELSSLLREKKDFAAALPHCEWLSKWADSEAAAGRDAVVRGRIHFDYGYALAQTGKEDLAYEEYLKALKLDPRNHFAWNNIGIFYQKKKNLVKAEESFREGLRIEPKFVLLNQNLAKVLLEQNQTEDALRQAELTLELKPDDLWLMIDIANCWAARGKKKQALEWLEKAVAAGFNNMDWLAQNPYFENLRNEGDYKKIVQGRR
jgi:tetratricopeptide (TPR) repeat protein